MKETPIQQWTNFLWKLVGENCYFYVLSNSSAIKIFFFYNLEVFVYNSPLVAACKSHIWMHKISIVIYNLSQNVIFKLEEEKLRIKNVQLHDNISVILKTKNIFLR